jgi:hypothetical protein
MELRGHKTGTIVSRPGKEQRMSQWTGKLYVYRDKNAQGHVSTALPNGNGRVEAFQVIGPFIPITPTKAVSVGDAIAWMAELTDKGFVFERCSMET